MEIRLDFDQNEPLPRLKRAVVSQDRTAVHRWATQSAPSCVRRIRSDRYFPAVIEVVCCSSDDDSAHRLPYAYQPRVCILLRRPDPDFAKVSRMMRNFFFAVGMQGAMQVLTIVIMARFVTGL